MFRLALSIILSIVATSFAENPIISYSTNAPQEENQMISQILEEQPDAVQGYEEGKLYLSPDRISTTAYGIYLQSEESSIYLPQLSSDQNGCYIALNDLTNSMKVRCGRCGFIFDLTEIVTNCPNCNYPER